MLEHAPEDRFESKKAAVHLSLTNKSPNVEYHLELWHARLTAYRGNTLKVKNAETAAPTGQHIERFVNSVVNHLQPYKGTAVSLGTIKVSLSSIIKASAFYFPDFKLTNHDTARLAFTLESLVIEGKLTRQKKFDKQWVGAFMLANMVRALYSQSLKEGVCN